MTTPLFRIRHVEPLLCEVDPQYDRKPTRLLGVARLRIVRSHHRLQARPRSHTLTVHQFYRAMRQPTPRHACIALYWTFGINDAAMLP